MGASEGLQGQVLPVRSSSSADEQQLLEQGRDPGGGWAGGVPRFPHLSISTASVLGL